MSGVSRRGLLAGAAALMTLEQARAQGVAPKRGGTLNALLTPEPPILVLGVNGQGPTLIAASKIYQGLLRYSPGLEPMPQLARAWQVSEDRRVYTFQLQPGVKWHDGHDFTAEDVIFTMMKFQMELAPRSRLVFSRITEIVAPDPLTVRVTLDAPFEPFLQMFDVVTCAMVPKHIYDGTDYRNNPANQTPIGTGPFRFVEWQRGNFIRLRRFEQYWKPGQPYLDEIIFRIVPDSQSRALALQTGQVQLTMANDIEPFDVPRFREQANLEVTTKGWEFFSPLMWIELNHRSKPLDDRRVRQAISLAVDRDFIVRRLWFGTGRPAGSAWCSTTRYYDGMAKLPGFDPKAAAALLDEAGLKPGANGVRFSLKHLPLPYGEVWQRLSEYLRTALGRVGIDLQMESTDAGGWARRMAAWEYDTSINFVYQIADPSLSVERSYVSSQIAKVTFSNTGGYSNPEVDRLFEQARLAAEPAVRQAAFSAVQRILVADVPQVWLVEMQFPTISDRRLHNTITLGTGNHACYDDVFLA